MYSNLFVHEERLYDDKQLEIIQRENNIFIFLIFTISLFIVNILFLVLIVILISIKAGFDIIIIDAFALFSSSIVFLFFLGITRRLFIFRSTKRVSLRFQFLMNPVLVAKYPELPFQMNNQKFTLSCAFRESERVNDTPFRKYTYIKPKSVVNLDAVSPQVLVIFGKKIIFSLNTLIDDS
ncbi:MAG: hypothetical protein ACFFAE_14550, partial [Candidatus Hodarchaeota archaeon]